MCFFAGGVRYAEQSIKSTAAQLNSSLLLIAVIAVLIPSAFHFSISTTDTGAGFSITNAEEATDLLAMSHAVAVILLVLYLGYLLFQMWTHAVSDRQTTSHRAVPDEAALLPR
jgi:Ca2+:H+ antiporter